MIRLSYLLKFCVSDNPVTLWRAGSWHCTGCGYDNYRENLGCRKSGVGGKEEGRGQ